MHDVELRRISSIAAIAFGSPTIAALPVVVDVIEIPLYDVLYYQATPPTVDVEHRRSTTLDIETHGHYKAQRDNAGSEISWE